MFYFVPALTCVSFKGLLYLHYDQLTIFNRKVRKMSKTRELEFKFEIPSTEPDEKWLFEYRVTITERQPLGVVVEWSEPTIGSGLFHLEDCSMEWLQNFKAHQKLHDHSLNVAFCWNVGVDPD